MAERIVIIDYGSGNLRSVEKAFERAARESGAAAAIAVTNDPEAVAAADRLVLPGVGAFGACMAGLAACDGVMEAMEHAVLVEGRPFLGICVGMQLLATRGREFGSHQGLGWIAGDVVPIAPDDPSVRSPHMGWNEIAAKAPCPLLEGVETQAFYFAHSFCFDAENDMHLIATTDHGGDIAAVIARDNIAGVQFHPEKSQRSGLALLKNFLVWDPA